MTKVSRDVLIVSKLSYVSEQALELEMHRVNALLYRIESLNIFCTITEIIDLARFKIIRKPQKILEALQKRADKPFVFIFNRN